MSVKKDINTDIETLLVSNAPFEYAHLIKFERPNAPDSIGFRTNANRYAYLTDASRDISFDDASTDQDGNANGAQIYRANRVKSVGSYSETIQAKSTSLNLVLGAEHLNTSVSITAQFSTNGTFAYQSGFTTEVFDFVEQGFREGDLVSISRNSGTVITDGTNTTASAKYIITGFSNSNQTLTLARTGNDSTSGFFDIGFPTTNLTEAFTITLESDELRGVLAIESNELASPTFFNREVFIYKIFIDPETGDVLGANDTNSINGILTFKGIISKCSLDEKSSGATVNWSLTSHWGDFNEVRGRITSDSAQRGLDASEEPNPLQALKPGHAADLGFLHAETSIEALAEYQRIEKRRNFRMVSSRAGGLRGAFGGRNYGIEEYEEEVVHNEKVDLDIGMKAASIPLVYGVRKIEGIPVFADTDKNDPKKVFVVYALAEGEIHGVYNTHIDDTSVVCIDESDFTTRNATDGTNKEETKMVCFGRMSRGDTLGGKAIEVANTNTTPYPEFPELTPEEISAAISKVMYELHGGNPLNLIRPVIPLFPLLVNYGSGTASAPVTNTLSSSTYNLTPTTLGGSKGLQNRQNVNFKNLFGDDFDLAVSFMRGTEDQQAMDRLVTLAATNSFKRQNDFYTTDIPYWSPNHRLLDTAYVLVEYNINEEMTELPELEHTVRGKVYENYNYDNTYIPDPATTQAIGTTPIYENDVVSVEISYNGGSSYENAKTSSGGTQFRIMDRYPVTNRLGVETYRFRLDVAPFYRNDGSTLVAPNGRPTYDKIRINKIGSGTWTMLPWNAGVVRTPTAFPDQRVNATAVGTSNGKVTMTVASLGNLAGTSQVQVVSQTAGEEPSGTLGQFKHGAYSVSISGNTFTFTGSRQFTSIASGSNVALQRARIFDFSSISAVSSITDTSDIIGEFLTIQETGERREITDFNTSTNKITIASPFMFPPLPTHTFTITGKGSDLRAGSNPAMQLLDYMTNSLYGKGLDLNGDIDLSSFITSARLCDVRSDVTVKLTGGTPTIGNRYVFNPGNVTGCNPPFSGKVKSFDSANNLVTFTECTGKLYHAYNNYRTFQKGDVILETNPPSGASGSAGFYQFTQTLESVLNNSPAQEFNQGTFITGLSGGANLTLTDGSTTLTMDRSVTVSYSLYDADFIKYWRYLNWEHHHQRWVTRHQTNFLIDTSKSVFANVNMMLAHFNGFLSYENGEYVLDVETQVSAPTSINTFNGNTYKENINPYFIEHSDIIGDIKLNDDSNKKSKNVVKASIPDPSISYESRSVTFLNSKYLEADRNVRKTQSLAFSGITNYFNGRINAEKALTETRYQKEISFRVGQKGLLMKPGQVMGLTYEPFGFTNKLFRIINLNFQADCTVTIKAVEYDDSAYLISRQRRSAIYSQDSGIDSTIKAPGAPTNLTVSTTKPGFFALSWTNATNFKESTDSTEIYASTSNLNNAILISTVDNATSAEFLIGEFSNRNFWVRHKRIHTSVANGRRVLHSAYAPDNTSGVAGVSKLLDPSFGFDRQNVTLNFEGGGSLNPSGTAQDTTFIVTKRNLSGTPTIQLLDADGTARSGNGTFTDGSVSITGVSATIDASTFVSTDTPKIVKATLTEGGETFTAIATIGILKQGIAGTAGIRTTTGAVYFSLDSATSPGAVDADNNAVFTFGTGNFTGLDSGTTSYGASGTWQKTPPEADPGDTTPKYWLADFTAVENSAGAGISSGSNLTFGTPSTFINFTDVVVFTDLSTSGTTTINGDNITTGTIKAINLESTNFAQNSNTSAVTAGSRFNLANGQIDSKEFSINSSGDANFSGTVAAGAVVSANISANQITSGTLNASNVTVTNLQAGNITGGLLDVGRIEANSINGVAKGTEHTYSTIKVTGGTYPNTFARISDVDADGAIRSSNGGAGINGVFGYSAVVYPSNFASTFGAATPFWVYPKVHGGVLRNIHCKRVLSVPFTVVQSGTYHFTFSAQMYGAFTGDEYLYLVLAVGDAAATPSTYVANETDGSGAVGSINTNHGNRMQSFVDSGQLGVGSFNMNVNGPTYLAGSSSGTQYYINCWAASANHGTGAGHYVSTINVGAFKQHV